MLCISCSGEINPKWKYAVDNNSCPFCGSAIMPDEVKSLLVSLRDVMDKLIAYPEQLNDWLLHNFGYIKTDSPDLIKFVPDELLTKTKLVKSPSIEKTDNKKFTVKIDTDRGQEEVMAEKIQSDEETNEFFKRADAVKPGIDGFASTTEKTAHLKKIVQQIKKSGTKQQADIEIEDADQEAIVEMQEILSGGNSIRSSIPDDEDEDIPPVVLAMARNSKGGASEQTDLAKLQQMHQRVGTSNKNFRSAKGAFTRG
jgi:hypothetical protein